MRFEWDAEKSSRNVRERGLPFEMAERMDWATAEAFPDRRRDYGEERFSALALLDGRLHACAYALRHGAIRINSLRKANERERAVYDRLRQTPTDRR